MSPTRSVNFELQMKPDALTRSRAPFRFSKDEQDALQQFAEDIIRKGWIEASNSSLFSYFFWDFKERSHNRKVPLTCWTLNVLDGPEADIRRSSLDG